MPALRVMVVDDSAFMRKIIGDMISSHKDLELLATARDGIDALKKLQQVKPDVITLDIEMPKMDGLTTLQEIVKSYNIPTIMVSSLTSKHGKITMEALAKGAYDFIEKPSGSISLDMNKVEEELIQKILSVKHTTPSRGYRKISFLKKEITPERPTLSSLQWEKDYRAIVIGASTGGPRALSEIIKRLPKEKVNIPIFIVQHMPKGFTTSFAERLNGQCSLVVKEAEQGESIQGGHIYIAPGGFHMTIEGKNIYLDQRDKILGVRPAVNYLFQSAAPVYRESLLGVILTGMGRDGTEGMKAIKKWGGTNIAQDEESSVIFGMPSSAIDSGVVHHVLSLDQVSQRINEVLRRRE